MNADEKPFVNSQSVKKKNEGRLSLFDEDELDTLSSPAPEPVNLKTLDHSPHYIYIDTVEKLREFEQKALMPKFAAFSLLPTGKMRFPQNG